MRTLHYACSAGAIRNKPVIKRDPQEQLIAMLRDEVKELKATVSHLRHELTLSNTRLVQNGLPTVASTTPSVIDLSEATAAEHGGAGRSSRADSISCDAAFPGVGGGGLANGASYALASVDLSAALPTATTSAASSTAGAPPPSRSPPAERPLPNEPSRVLPHSSRPPRLGYASLASSLSDPTSASAEYDRYRTLISQRLNSTHNANAPAPLHLSSGYAPAQERYGSGQERYGSGQERYGSGHATPIAAHASDLNGLLAAGGTPLPSPGASGAAPRCVTVSLAGGLCSPQPVYVAPAAFPLAASPEPTEDAAGSDAASADPLVRAKALLARHSYDTHGAAHAAHSSAMATNGAARPSYPSYLPPTSLNAELLPETDGSLGSPPQPTRAGGSAHDLAAGAHVRTAERPTASDRERSLEQQLRALTTFSATELLAAQPPGSSSGGWYRENGLGSTRPLSSSHARTPSSTAPVDSRYTLDSRYADSRYTLDGLHTISSAINGQPLATPVSSTARGVTATDAMASETHLAPSAYPTEATRPPAEAAAVVSISLADSMSPPGAPTAAAAMPTTEATGSTSAELRGLAGGGGAATPLASARGAYEPVPSRVGGSAAASALQDYKAKAKALRAREFELERSLRALSKYSVTAQL